MVSANVPDFVEQERGTYPPLGLLSIAACLRERGPAGVRVQVLDTVVHDLDDEQIAHWLQQEAPDLVGIQTLTFTLLDTLAVVGIVKQLNPRTVVVLGGRHCDIYPRETLAQPGVDYVVSGEGELTLCRLVAALADPAALAAIPGLTFRQGGEVISNPPEPIMALDTLPLPARDLTPYQDYRFLLAKKSLYTTLITSRGCPFTCVFCDEGEQPFRAVSASRVVAEMVDCYDRLGIDQFFIFDSTFTVDRQRVLEICRQLREAGRPLTFDVRSRIDLMDEEMLRALRGAGCIRIQYGVEAGCDRILAAIGKRITVEQVRRVVAMTRRHGFEILCDFMVGLPGETEREIGMTIDLALELPINYAQFAITVPYPHTRLYHEGLNRGMYDDYWRDFAARPTPAFTPRVWQEHLDQEQLTALMMRAYERFYYRPSYIVGEFLRMRSPAEIWRKTRAGIHLIVRSLLGRKG